MNECLVINLKESSTAENLTRLGALKFRVKLEVYGTIIIQLYSHTKQTIRVNKSAHFPDGSQIYNADAGWISTSIQVAAEVIEIEFSDKFGISLLYSVGRENPMWGDDGATLEIYVDFEDFKYCTSLESIFFSLGKGGGNLESLKNLPLQNIFLDPNDNKLIVEGDISHVLGQPNFERFVIKNQPLVTGDLCAFSGKSVAYTFDLSNTSVTGNIENLSGVRANDLLLKGMRKFIGGDIGKLHDDVRFFTVVGSQNTAFTFTEYYNNTRTNFLAIQDGFMVSGINKLIKKSADLTLPTPEAPDYARAIRVWGAYDFKKEEVQVELDYLRDNSIEVWINDIRENP